MALVRLGMSRTVASSTSMVMRLQQHPPAARIRTLSRSQRFRRASGAEARRVGEPPFSVVPDNAIADLVEYANRAPIGGCFVEVGVYRGGTGWHLARVAQSRGEQVFLYDTFTGIPYKAEDDFHTPGDFNDTSRDEVAAAIPYASVVEGLFPESIVPMPAVSFAHIDCDQYQAIVESVKALVPMMMDEGIMVFDDFGCLDGATRAVRELFPANVINITRFGKAWVRF